MKKIARNCSCILFAASISFFFVDTALSFSGAGGGTIGDPYVITSVDQLQEMNDELDAHYVLGNDIDASDTLTWNSGQGFDPVGPFLGSFEGRGFLISQLFINRPTENQVGLFGSIWSTTIRDVNLQGGSVTGAQSVGHLCGYCSSSQVTNCGTTGAASGETRVGGLLGALFPGSSVLNCFSEGIVVGTGGSMMAIGGLVGYNDGSNVTKCYATGSVSGEDRVGGLVGDCVSFANTVQLSYASGDVAGNVSVGGLVGATQGEIQNSYASGSVNGNDEVGGFVGEVAIFGSVTNCYSIGDVSGLTDTGGFLGREGTFTTSYFDCFWDTQTSGMANGVGNGEQSGVTGKTTVEMKQQNTFTNWSFPGIWVIDEGNDYPRLRWQLGEAYSAVENWRLLD